MAEKRLMMLSELFTIIAIAFAFHFKAYFKSTNALYQMNSIHLQITKKKTRIQIKTVNQLLKM